MLSVQSTADMACGFRLLNYVVLAWILLPPQKNLTVQTSSNFFFSYSRMIKGSARSFASTGTEIWCADSSGKARVVGALQYCWVYAFLWMKAWSMAIINWWWRTITACLILISFGNTFYWMHNSSFESNWWNPPNLDFWIFKFTWQLDWNIQYLLG